MIPINLGLMAFVTFIIIYVPLLLLLTWYCFRGLKYFYKRYYKKQLAYSSAFLEIRYFIAISFLFYVLTIFLVEYSKGYYYYRLMTLDKPTLIDDLLFPAQTTGRFSKNKSGLHFDTVRFAKPFKYKGLKISSMATTYDYFLRVTPVEDVAINGIYCDKSMPVKIAYDGNLMHCFLDSGNTFSGVEIPKKLNLEHYKAGITYRYNGKKNKDLNYQWTLNSVDSYTINGTRYSDVEFFIDKDLNIVKFVGDLATKNFDDKQIREMIKKEKELR